MLLTAALIAATLAVPAAARATLAYVKYGRYPLAPRIFTATDNGYEESEVARGDDPRVSPDGELLAYLNQVTPDGRRRLKVVSVHGGASRLLADAKKISQVTWSPDSSAVAAVRGPGKGPDMLVLINVDTGGQRVLARGHITGVSFSPAGNELVYSRSTHRRSGSRSDVFRVSARGGRSARLTFDHRSRDPLWGADFVAFVKKTGRKGESALFVMAPDGGGVRRLVGTGASRGRHRLFPIDWSADGSRLLAGFRGPESSLSFIVEPRTRSYWFVGRRKANFAATAFSCDGESVLGSFGRVGPLADHRVGAIGAGGGGRMHVLAEFAYEPDWNEC